MLLAYFLFDLVAVPRHIETHDGDVPGVGLPQTFDDLDGGGLAGAIWTEHSKDLALLNGKADTIDDAGLVKKGAV